MRLVQCNSSLLCSRIALHDNSTVVNFLILLPQIGSDPIYTPPLERVIHLKASGSAGSLFVHKVHKGRSKNTNPQPEQKVQMAGGGCMKAVRYTTGTRDPTSPFLAEIVNDEWSP